LAARSRLCARDRPPPARPRRALVISDDPDALPAIRAWTAALLGDLDTQDRRIAQGQLAGLDIPVRLVFGALDCYLSPGLAAHLAGLFGRADLHLVDGASHWPQWDQPEAVAELIR
jgi:pimeloyl-ACP methyl ester carboxylesterase